jgi:hypothetical protein
LLHAVLGVVAVAQRVAASNHMRLTHVIVVGMGSARCSRATGASGKGLVVVVVMGLLVVVALSGDAPVLLHVWRRRAVVRVRTSANAIIPHYKSNAHRCAARYRQRRCVASTVPMAHHDPRQ